MKSSALQPIQDGNNAAKSHSTSSASISSCAKTVKATNCDMTSTKVSSFKLQFQTSVSNFSFNFSFKLQFCSTMAMFLSFRFIILLTISYFIQYCLQSKQMSNGSTFTSEQHITHGSGCSALLFWCHSHVSSINWQETKRP
jgi:hypothetical protein